MRSNAMKPSRCVPSAYVASSRFFGDEYLKDVESAMISPSELHSSIGQSDELTRKAPEPVSQLTQRACCGVPT